MRTFKPLAFLAMAILLCVLPKLTAEERLDLPGAKPQPQPQLMPRPPLQAVLVDTASFSAYPWESPDEAGVRERLAKRIGEVNLDGIAFDQLVQYLRDLTGLNIVVNWSALETAAIENDKEVTLNLAGGTVSYRTALELILEDVGGGEVDLGFTLYDGVILISTKEDLARRTQVVFYNVSDIIRMAELRNRDWESLGRLVAMIQQTIDPESWREAGGNTGAITDFSDILVVTQTHSAHEMIWELLQGLRLQMGLPMEGPMAPLVIK